MDYGGSPLSLDVRMCTPVFPTVIIGQVVGHGGSCVSLDVR